MWISACFFFLQSDAAEPLKVFSQKCIFFSTTVMHELIQIYSQWSIAFPSLVLYPHQPLLKKWTWRKHWRFNFCSVNKKCDICCVDIILRLYSSLILQTLEFISGLFVCDVTVHIYVRFFSCSFNDLPSYVIRQESH